MKRIVSNASYTGVFCADAVIGEELRVLKFKPHLCYEHFQYPPLFFRAVISLFDSISDSRGGYVSKLVASDEKKLLHSYSLAQRTDTRIIMYWIKKQRNYARL